MLNLVGRRAASHIAPLTSSQYNNLWFILGKYILAAQLINFTSVSSSMRLCIVLTKERYIHRKKSQNDCHIWEMFLLVYHTHKK